MTYATLTLVPTVKAVEILERFVVNVCDPVAIATEETEVKL